MIPYRWHELNMIYYTYHVYVSTLSNLEKGKERELGFVKMRQKVALTTKTKKTVIGFTSWEVVNLSNH